MVVEVEVGVEQLWLLLKKKSDDMRMLMRMLLGVVDEVVDVVDVVDGDDVRWLICCNCYCNCYC